MLDSYITKTEIDLQWGEMDAMQHLNNLVYLRYFESSRIRFFEQIMQTSITNKGVGIILAEISCKFKYPLTYPDTVISACKPIIESIDDYSFQMHQVVFSKKHQRIAAEGIAKMVFYDYDHLKKAHTPKEFLQQMTLLKPTNVG